MIIILDFKIAKSLIDCTIVCIYKHKLFTIVKTHCTTKAAEISIPIDLQDIYNKKSYLGGKSIEQIIHETKDKQGEHIFNHLGHGWTTAYNSTSYIVTACKTKIDEAQLALMS